MLLFLLDISISSWVNIVKIIFLRLLLNKIKVLLLTSWGKSWVYVNVIMSGHSCFKSSEKVKFKMVAIGKGRVFCQSWLWIFVVINILTFLPLLRLRFWKGWRISIFFNGHIVLSTIGNCFRYLCIIELLWVLLLWRNFSLRNFSGRFINRRNSNIFNNFSWDKILIIFFFQGILLRLNLFRYIYCIRNLDSIELRAILLIPKTIWFKVICMSDGSMIKHLVGD